MTLLRALYEYSGEDDDELSFPEGAELELIHTDEGVNDGFWKGQYNGRVGLFPSVVVEIISNGMVSLIPSTTFSYLKTKIMIICEIKK